MVEEEDWSTPYVDYLTKGTLPDNNKTARKLEKRARKFFVIDGELFRRSFNQKTLKCVDKEHAIRIMEDPTKGINPYYPQGNGQAESSNKTLLRILSRSLYDNNRTWHEELPLALMAYRIAKHAIIPAEVIIASTRILSSSGVDLDSQRIRSLDMIDERRDIAERKHQQYRDRRARSYNQHVKERPFENEELVLTVAPHVQREGSARKFTPNWEGPFRIRKVGGSGYYKLEHADGSKIKGKRNSKINRM
ncbi:uncharacterized protein LOC113359762 [Papaver somniferum]|uniref:uncharacterized protein LOC113359762 n=1 Tax=Papaver somniferum TaxID=3469 RepID=UPI000E703DEB|nr:uncharacterized protein LOC113359762 [Papaver somniferum]